MSTSLRPNSGVLPHSLCGFLSRGDQVRRNSLSADFATSEGGHGGECSRGLSLLFQWELSEVMRADALLISPKTLSW
jgi:hypothetical protein